MKELGQIALFQLLSTYFLLLIIKEEILLSPFLYHMKFIIKIFKIGEWISYFMNYFGF